MKKITLACFYIIYFQAYLIRLKKKKEKKIKQNPQNFIIRHIVKTIKECTRGSSFFLSLFSYRNHLVSESSFLKFLISQYFTELLHFCKRSSGLITDFKNDCNSGKCLSPVLPIGVHSSPACSRY